MWKFLNDSIQPTSVPARRLRESILKRKIMSKIYPVKLKFSNPLRELNNWPHNL
jgi:hypothetical protein